MNLRRKIGLHAAVLTVVFPALMLLWVNGHPEASTAPIGAKVIALSPFALLGTVTGIGTGVAFHMRKRRSEEEP